MCGICGVMSLRPPGPDATPITETAVIRMRDAMRHRGPDDEGVFVADGVGLGHRRLSIIDLSGGHQPMANPDETVWITYNGEVYNFQELREELEARGLGFRTKSDTEVIVRGYEAYGDAVVERLRGMFAFAMWDARRRRLLLARDPLGIKPLYYTQTADGFFLFASEIRALLTWPGVRAEVDLDALWDYLGQRYVPGPRTIFKGIAKLPAGHVAVVSGGEVTLRRYWDVPLDGETWSEAECVGAFRDLVTDSVRRELVSDVPLGVFLSGGLDSTAVTALMASMVSDPVRTFCVGYGGEQGVNERPYARLAAERLGTVHREVEVGLEEFWQLLPQAVAAMEEPVAEAPSVSLLQLSRFTREHVTVVLSGEGADENLGGYGIYRHLLRARPLRWLGTAGPLADLYGSHRAARALERIRQGIAEYRGVSAIFTRHERERLLGRREPAVDSAAVHHERSRRLSPLQRMLYYDQKVWLPDDLLVKADKMTMAASLELRVPFLDHRVVEWAWRVPSSLKIRGGVGKVLLRQAFADVVPAPILERAKVGFTVGGGGRFADNVGREARRLLLDEQALDGLVDSREVARLVRRHTEGVENLLEQLMVLIVLAWWRRLFLS
ncbi:MAG: asparagine synthase (glutamine-hydrolyzing) [Candidatus Rokuibacteriota bacterium]|nr:MAG: asparagine synthase (glutamine-hydrolyzing) [Candidatus Rokubacteria bacterium]